MATPASPVTTSSGRSIFRPAYRRATASSPAVPSAARRSTGSTCGGPGTGSSTSSRSPSGESAARARRLGRARGKPQWAGGCGRGRRRCAHDRGPFPAGRRSGGLPASLARVGWALGAVLAIGAVVGRVGDAGDVSFALWLPAFALLLDTGLLARGPAEVRPRRLLGSAP